MEAKSSNEQRLLTVRDCAEKLSLCERKVHELIATEELPSRKIGAARRVLWTDLLAFMEGGAA